MEVRDAEMFPVEVLLEKDVAVDRTIFVDTNPQRTGRRIPKTLDAARAKLQIGKWIWMQCD